jgi:hypothetical protein
MGLLKLFLGGNGHSDPNKPNRQAVKPVKKITSAEVVAKARQRVGGVQNILHVEKQAILRNNLWRVTLINRVDRWRYYIEINAETGAITTYRPSRVPITNDRAQNVALEKVRATHSNEYFRPHVVKVVQTSTHYGVRVRVYDPYVLDFLIEVNKDSGEAASSVTRLNKPDYRPRPKDKKSDD